MDTQAAREMIAVIRAERERRIGALENEDSDYANDRWMFTDEPFVNELCLVLLVTIRHLLERELLRLAARATADGKEIRGSEYWKQVADGRAQLRKRGWKPLAAKLNLASFPAWNTSLETLRLLANTYKHEPGYGKPGDDLLKHLGLDPVISRRPKVTYASLPESGHFREALAQHLSLEAEATYCDIAEEFLACVERFVADVERQPQIGAVRFEPVSLSEFVG